MVQNLISQVVLAMQPHLDNVQAKLLQDTLKYLQTLLQAQRHQQNSMTRYT